MLQDVAQEAGVSQATVSKVMNGRSDVSTATRARVLEATQKVGYEPIARSQVPHIPSIVIAFDSFAPVYSSEVLSGAVAQCDASGIRVHVDYSPSRDRQIEPSAWVARQLAAGAIGGLFITAEIGSQLTSAAADAHFHIVAVDPKQLDDSEVTTIGATNWTGAANATQHLIDLGHQRIAFGGLDLQSDYSSERFGGYRAVLDRAGLAVDPNYIGYGNSDFRDGQQIGERFARLSSPPTGIVAVSDSVALGMIGAARREGLNCPDDISIVGFDDIQPAKWSTPRLTTVRQPLAEIGAMAVRTLLDLAHGKVLNLPHLQLSTKLIVRDSTAGPKS